MTDVRASMASKVLLAARAEGTCGLIVEAALRIHEQLEPLVGTDPERVRDVLDDVGRALAILEHGRVVLARDPAARPST
jgi:hypothetical protein